MNNTITDNINIWITAQTQKSMGRNRGIDNIHQHGVKRLRELILELAVRGKLVPQDPNDEPASVLLKKIAEEKKRLTKIGEIKKTKILPEITDDEIPFGLPRGWSFERLNEIGDWGAGATPNRSKPEYYGGEIPWFKSGELIGEYISESEEFVTELALKETSLRYNKVGDVLIAMYGATIGKTSILKIPATTNQAVCACTPFDGIFNVFLLTLLKAYKSRFIGMGAGGAQPNISREKIIATVFALPPLAEQHRIVAKVDELMVLCDKLEQQQTASLETHQLLVETLLKTLTDAKDASELNKAWQQIESNFGLLFTTEESVDLLKQTILQLAVMGKLTQDFRKQNPELVSGANSARELLKKIAAEKEKLIAEGKIKRQNPLPEITDDEKPFELPEGWEWVRLGDITNKIGSGSTPRGGNKAYCDSGIIFLRSQNIRNEGLLLDDVAYITQETNKKMSNTIVESNDILLNITGGSLGRSTIFPENLNIANVSQHVTIVRLTEKSSSRFIHLAILSPYIQNLIWGRQVGANREGLSKRILELFEFPVPPLSEQYQIVSKVDELFALCDALKERIDESQEIKIKLADAVVEGALKDKPAGKVIYSVNEQLSLAAEPE